MRHAVLVAVLAAGCQARTELVLGVATDLAATDQIDNVLLNVERTDGFPESGDGQSWDITGVLDQPYNLPGSYGLYSDGQDVQLNVTLTASHGGQTVVSQRAVLSIVSGQTLFYRMGLTSLCESDTCSANQTCVEGKCIDPVVPVDQLPRYSADLVDTLTCIGPVTYIDTGTHLPMKVSADAASCPPDLCLQGVCLNPPPGGSGSGAFTGAMKTYIKPLYPSSGSLYGSTMSLSYDGTILALGGPDDSLGGTGVLPEEEPPGAPALSSGGVYTYFYDGMVWARLWYLKASNAESNDAFGTSVAVSGDGNTLAVGATGESSNAIGIDGDQTNNLSPASGAVYIFTHDDEFYTQQAYIKASTNLMVGFFGGAVALSNDGNTLAVGEVKDQSNATGINGNEADTSANASGAVFVFTRDVTGTWTQQAYVKASNTDIGDGFGSSVALSSDGNTLVVASTHEASAATGIGGNQADNSASSAGAVYVFSRAGTAWSQQAYVKASNTRTAQAFGTSISLSADGNALAVGAIGESSNAVGVNGDQTNTAAGGSGAAYVFTRAGTTWEQQAYLKASNTSAMTAFGSSVALSPDGSSLAVGSDLENSNALDIGGDQTNTSAASSGAAYVFAQSNGTWAQQAYVKASNTRPMAQFGSTVALSMSGSTFVVGSSGESSASVAIDGDQTDTSSPMEGAAYAFQ